MKGSKDMVGARIAEVEAGAERRRSARRDVDFDAQLREMGQEGQAAHILNVSDHGFMAELDHLEIEAGARIWLILPSGERASALVKWTAGDRLGAEFFEPVKIEQLLAR